MLRLALPVLASLLAFAPALRAQMRPDSGYFLIRLGTDTTGVERYVRAADRLDITSVQRSPRTLVREIAVLFGPDGTAQRAEVTSRPGDAAPGTPGTRTVITFEADSATIETTRADGTASTRRAAFGPDDLPLNFDIFSPYEIMLQEVLGSDGELAAARTFWKSSEDSPFRVERLSRDSAILHHPVLGELRARLDGRDRLVALISGGGFGTSVQRVRSLDVAALAAEFAARDAAGAGLGPLSPRDTTLVAVHGAEMMVDYGRPSKRGRPVFGGLVPWNQVWRLGANLATHFWTERDLILDGNLVPAGLYTLYLLPRPSDWLLIVNAETGQAGTDYDQDRDVARVRLRNATLPEPVEQLTIAVEEQGNGGAIHIRWDRTQASTPFTFAALTPARRMLDDVARALGGKRRIQGVRTLLLEGQGQSFRLGQNATPEADLPALEIAAYRRAVDFADRRWRQELSIESPFAPPGAGPQRQVSALDGDVAFNVQVNGNAVRAAASTARDRALELLLHPIGALQAAWTPGTDIAIEPGRANRVRVTREGEQFSIGFDPTTRVITSIERPAYHPLLGDVTLEAVLEDYRDVDGLRLPGRMLTRLDGRTLTDIRLDSIAVGGDVGDLAAPADVRAAPAPEPAAPNVAAEEIAPGIWYLTGQSHHSVLVEFGDHLMLIEAPQNEARTLAVIAKARELRPDKPLRYLVNTHHHFDHAGGIRAAIAEGLTIVTHEANRSFYEDIAARPHTIVQDALARNPRPLSIETVADRRVLRDGTRTVEVYPIRGTEHAGTLLMVYFPRERLLVEADVYSPPPPGAAPRPAPFAADLLENVRSRRLRVERIVPIHGRVVPFEDLVAAATRAE